MKLCFFLCLLLWVESVFAQQKDSIQNVEDVDLMDVFHKAFRIKAEPEKPVVDSVGQRLMFNVLPGFGYTLSTNYEANLSFSASFKRPYANYSNILFIPTVTSRKQFIFPLTVNVWSKNNRYNFVGEMHAFKYPQSTFGIGARTLPRDEIPQIYNYLRLHDFLYRHVIKYIYLGLGLHLDKHWKIKQDSLDKRRLHEMYPLGISHQSFTMGYSLNLLFDNRTNSINPTGGTYWHFHYRKNLLAFGSNYHSDMLVSNFKHYILFPRSSRNILAFWNYNTFLLKGNLPYLDLPSTAWDFTDRTGRGYLQGRFRGRNWLYGESEYRFVVSRNGLFGGVVFVNAQSFSEAQTSKFQKVVFAGGAGIRIKLNKLSRTNVAIDYAFGKNGSHGLTIDIGEIF